MKRYIHILSAISLLTFASCQKVVNLDLAGTSPQYVVEGSITNAAGPYTVMLTKTIDISKDNNYPAITNAVVVIADNAGTTDTLSQSGPGRYVTKTIQGV